MGLSGKRLGKTNAKNYGNGPIRGPQRLRQQSCTGARDAKGKLYIHGPRGQRHPARVRDGALGMRPSRTIDNFTGPEVKALSVAFGFDADDWSEQEGDMACKSGNYIISYADDPLSGEYKNLTADEILILHYVLNALLYEDETEIDLGETIEAIGWYGRSAADRKANKRLARSRIRCLSHFAVRGTMLGKKGEHLTVDWTLFHTDKLVSREGTDEPLTMKVLASEWWRKHRNDHRVIPRLGDVRLMSDFPSKQPRGQWARTYTQALYQRWRERLRDVKGGKYPVVTRRRAHELFRRTASSGDIFDILAGQNPGRAIKADESAWALLEERGIIEKAPQKFQRGSSRKGWQDAFLDERITVKPGPAMEAQAAQSAGKATQSAGTGVQSEGIQVQNGGLETKSLIGAAMSANAATPLGDVS